MLVLSRALGEKIFIGENICITVFELSAGRCRLGIEAPRDIPIYRTELLPLAVDGETVAVPVKPLERGATREMTAEEAAHLALMDAEARRVDCGDGRQDTRAE